MSLMSLFLLKVFFVETGKILSCLLILVGLERMFETQLYRPIRLPKFVKKVGEENEE